MSCVASPTRQSDPTSSVAPTTSRGRPLSKHSLIMSLSARGVRVEARESNMGRRTRTARLEDLEDARLALLQLDAVEHEQRHGLVRRRDIASV